MMADLIAGGLIAAAVAAALYVYRAKKSGKKCIGCPDPGSCSGGCAGYSGCRGHGEH